MLTDCEAYQKLHAAGTGRTLIVCGAYKIGKEKVWMAIAQTFNYKVWVNKERRKALECLDNPDIINVLVDNPIEANIHVLTMNEISYTVRMRRLYKSYSNGSL